MVAHESDSKTSRVANVSVGRLYIQVLSLSEVVAEHQVGACRVTCGARIDDSGIEYRSLLGGSFRIPYSEIDSLRTHTIRTSRGLYRQWVLQLRDGRSLPMNLKPFVSSAYSVLLQRIRGGA